MVKVVDVIIPDVIISDFRYTAVCDEGGKAVSVTGAVAIFVDLRVAAIGLTIFLLIALITIANVAIVASRIISLLRRRLYLMRYTAPIIMV